MNLITTNEAQVALEIAGAQSCPSPLGQTKTKGVIRRQNNKVSDASDAFAAPLGSAVRSTTYEQS